MSGALLLLPLLALSAQPDEPAPSAEAEAAPAETNRGGLGTMIEPPAGPVDPGVIEGRVRPGFNADLPDETRQDNPGAVRAPPPSAFPTDQIPIPDRWRLIQNLGLVVEDPLDPYNQNTYKGDRPICTNSDTDRARRQALRDAAAAAGTEPPYGSARCLTPRFLGLECDNWFFIANAISDTVIEPRTFPIPVGVQTTQDPDRLDVFGARSFSIWEVNANNTIALVWDSGTLIDQTIAAWGHDASAHPWVNRLEDRLTTLGPWVAEKPTG